MYLFPLTSFAGSSLLKDRMETSVSMGDNFQTRRTSCKIICFKENTKYERTRNRLTIITLHNSQIKVDRFALQVLFFPLPTTPLSTSFKKKQSNS